VDEYLQDILPAVLSTALHFHRICISIWYIYNGCDFIRIPVVFMKTWPCVEKYRTFTARVDISSQV